MHKRAMIYDGTATAGGLPHGAARLCSRCRSALLGPCRSATNEPGAPPQVCRRSSSRCSEANNQGRSRPA